MCSTSQENVPRMAVGDRFASAAEFFEVLADYEQVTKQKFWRRTSHKIAAVNVKRILKPELEFYDMHYCCIHGGLKFKTRSKGERQTSTHKMDCPVFIKLLASTCGNFLEIRTVNLKHENHDLSLNAFEHLPQNRKLTPSERSDAESLLKLGCNKKKLQNKISSETSKHPTLKDLTNISSAIKKDDENDLSCAVNLLEKTYRATVSVLRDQDKHFKGLYFSTEDMRNSMGAWPEIVLIDGTYKLLAQDFTLMLLLVEDSNRLSEVVAVCLIVHEDRETFEWFLGCFKRENEEACAKINCFMADKDLIERNVLKEIFGVPVYICLFHTLKTFSRQITADRMGSSNPIKRQEVLKLLESLVYSSSDDDYNEKYERFRAVAPERVLAYYDVNWHPIKAEWTVYSMCHGNLENWTNNRLESINNKIKQVVPKRSTLKAFIDNFFEWLNSHKYERDHKAAQHVLKRQVTIFAPDTCEDRYLRLLTSYAFRYVIDSIERSKSIMAFDVNEDTSDGRFVIKGSKRNVETTLMSCQCRFWNSMHLPCKHIFAIRKLQDRPMFDMNLIDLRWTREFYLQTQRTFRSKYPTPPISPVPVVTETKRQRALTLTEKRKRASLITSSLVTLASLSSKAQFLCKLQVLKDIERFWRDGFEVTVEKIEINSSRSIASSTTADVEDEFIARPTDSSRPLRKISESSEDFDFHDVTSLDCELIDKVLGWDTEFGVDDLDEILQASSSSRRNISFDLGGISTPPPESLFYTAGALKTIDVAQPVVALFDKQDGSIDAVSASMSNTNTLLATHDDAMVSRTVISQSLNAEVQPTTSLTKDEENSITETELITRSVIAPNPVTAVAPATTVAADDASLPGEIESAETSSFILDACNSHASDNLKDIIMPKPCRVRGRPKGALLTAIGLKRTRKAGIEGQPLRTRNSAKAPLQFKKRPAREQTEIILGWFVAKEIIPSVISGKYKIKESDVEVRPELISNVILDKHVALNLVQNYMDEDAFDSIIRTVETKRKEAIWECPVCTEKLEDQAVICDSCFTWYHFKCAGLKRVSHKSVWFCSTCVKQCEHKQV